MKWKPAAWLLGAVLAAGFGLLLPGQQGLVLAILLFTMVLWVSELLPLAVTGLLSSLLLIVVGLEAKPVFAAYFDPVIVLLLGGFFLGVALRKHGLDRTLAGWMMQRTHGSAKWTLLALMLTTATFSMWISNTASTAIMLPIALGLVGTGRSPNLAKALVLGVAFSANVGGIATPIGTTPNPIALRFLADAGIQVSFLGWMVRMAPLTFAMVGLLWLILVRMYPADDAVAPPDVSHHKVHWGLVAVFGITVTLWLTGDLHGFSAATVSLLAVVLLFATRTLHEEDIRAADWPTLLLIGSGLALGDAALRTGLDGRFAGAIDAMIQGSGFTTFLLVGAAAIVMTIMASNTAAAVIMIPIVLQLGAEWGAPVMPLTLLATAVLSMDFLVPVGTPPNAMAYGTGHINVAQMARPGAIASVAGVLVASAAAYWLW